MEFLIKVLLNALALFAAAYLLRPNVQIRDFGRALILAIVLALLNGTLGSVLKVIALPLNVLTLGLFSFVINALMILIADYFLKGFQVKGFWWALVMAVLMSIFNSILYRLFL
ncbi:MAG: phage holin family protein [Saprospirales bacterium]|nr:phage holin family protein [Saprospirales bacterium]MBK8491242.1 phage holin family protein [Saprospirales bacterium]